MNPTIISEEAICMSDVLKGIKKSAKDTELNFRAQKTLDYLDQNTMLKDSKKVKELFGKLMGLEVPRLKELHIVKVIDLMPISENELKSCLTSYSVSVNNDNLKKIVSVLDDYR